MNREIRKTQETGDYELVVAEHFEWTPAIHDHTNKQIDSLKRALPEGARVTVFLSEPNSGRHDFTARMVTHARGRDFVGAAHGPDLYRAMREAREALVRQLRDGKQKKVDSRRRAAKKKKKTIRSLVEEAS